MSYFKQPSKLSPFLSRLLFILLLGTPRFIYSQDKAHVDPTPTLINELRRWQNSQTVSGDENWDDRFGPNDDLDDYDERVHAIAVADSEIYIGGFFG